MKVLILSNPAWDDNNCFGSTFSNFFAGMEDVEIANVYCRFGRPNNDLPMRCFQINEKMLLQNLKDKEAPSGREVFGGEDGVRGQLIGKKMKKRINWMRFFRLRVFFWARELVWRMGRPMGPQLKAFIDDFDPDVIFQPIYDSMYLTRLARRIKAYTGKPMAGFIGDDVYTLKQVRFSPLYWIDRLMKRPGLRRLIKSCDSVFVMTELQKKEYDGIFGFDSHILTKSFDFNEEPPQKRSSKPFVFTYCGNVLLDRWKTLAKIGRAMDELRQEGYEAELRIYTFDQLSGRIERAFSCPSIKRYKAVPAKQLPEVYSAADALVFVDDNTLKYKGRVRLSFSTKLVDYMNAGRCIFAVGPEQIAPIDHLMKHDGACIVTDQKDIKAALRRLMDDPALFGEYGKKAWECGASNHRSDEIRGRLYGVLKDLSEKSGER